MAGEWATATVGDVSKKVTKGTTPTTLGGRFVASGIAFIKVESLTEDGRIDRDKLAFIDSETNQLLARSIVEEDDVLFTIAGTIGRVARVSRSALPANTNQAVAIVRPNPEVIDPKFLYYALRDGARVRQAHTRVVQSVQANFSLSELSALEIPLPPLSEQRAVASILGALDDKIELNRRMSDTLEAMARALFKSWFVDFEPARAKAEGRDPRLPKHLADLFPARLVDSELGEIPEGWEVGRLSRVAEHPRRIAKPEQIASATAYIALEHMPQQRIALSEWGVSDGLQSNKFQFSKGEILFGKLRPYFHKVGVAPVDGVCSTDVVVVRPRSTDWFGFVLGHLSSDAFVSFTVARATGTRMPRTSWDEMARYTIAVPPAPLASEFARLVQLCVDRMIAGIHEARTLADLRDLLLPRLLSGEIQVEPS